MNKHLKLVRDFHDAFSFPLAEKGVQTHLSDMDIIMHQSLLMEEGSEVMKAIKKGEMAEILAGLVELAYSALGAIAMRGEDVTDRPVSWQHDGYVISVMRLLSDKINNCTSGNTDHYSEVYCSCVHLARSFLNADFDKAFQVVHENNMTKLDESGKVIYEYAGKIRKLKPFKAPELSECLY